MRTPVLTLATAALLAGGISCKGTIDGSGSSRPPGETDPGAAGTGGNPSGPMAEAGSSGSPDGGSDDAGGPAVVPFEAIAPASYTAKVKTLLTGLPPTSDELASVSQNPKALRGLIDAWMSTPQFQTKMLVFFKNAFQQAQVDGSALLDQLGGRGIPSNGATQQRLLVNIQESFPRTVWNLVASGKPFNQAIDTRQYMVTTALASYLAFTDDRFIDDKQATKSRWVAANPKLAVTASSDLTIAFADSINPTSANYLKFSTGMAMPNCVNPERSFTGQDAPYQLYSMLMGRVDTDKLAPDAMTCRAFNSPPVFTDADFNDWHLVTIRAPKITAAASTGTAGTGGATTPSPTTEPTTRFYDVAALRTAKELVLNVPRIGFWTPAFFANWSTNTSNLYRVTMNQTLIVGLGHSFDGSNSTVPVSEVGLDAEHAAPGTACYGCHQTLDPMKQLITQTFSLYYHEQTDATKAATTGVFTYAGVSKVISGASELASALASHPTFATAWAQKLCYYADSAACSEDDPEFQRVVGAFQAAKLDWKALVRELFSSPLVTGTARTKTWDDRGMPLSVARRDHYCGALEVRLGISDPCGMSGLPGLTGAQNAVATLARGLPSDGYSRGAETPVLPTDSSLFFRSGTENICRRLATQVVDVAATATNPTPSRYQSANPDAAIADFVATLMGLPDGDPRAAEAKQILTEHYQSALKTTGIKAKDALQSTFVLACTAPSTISVGL
jgi:hypothetical protein